MKAILYELYVPLSDMDWVHSTWTPIKEVFIPKLGICFNSKGFAFKTDKTRYEQEKTIDEKYKVPRQPEPKKLEDIEISSKDIAEIMRLIDNRKTVNRLGKKLFKKTIYNEDEEE